MKHSASTYIHIPLNLPHAGTVARRIHKLLPSRLPPDGPSIQAMALSEQLLNLLVPFEASGENPVPHAAEKIRQEAARLARLLVAEIESLEAGEDRLGQCIRNLFECLEMGQEGASISLRAGENPRSLQRP